MNTCGKNGYPDKKAALTAKNFRMTNHRRGRGKARRKRPEFLRAYACPDCLQWHLTSQPTGKKPEYRKKWGYRDE